MNNLKHNKKIKLTAYDYKKDIEKRVFLSGISEVEFMILEEILFSPVQFSMKKMAKNLQFQEDTLLSILQKFQRVGLVEIQGDSMRVDKEMREYFAIEIGKFAQETVPGLELMQNRLKNFPNFDLSSLYHVFRPGDFQSLVESYLYTPEIFQKHMIDMGLGHPAIFAIAEEVFRSSSLEVSAKALMDRFSISREQFHEYMLMLELHFVCCVRYEKRGNVWEERVTPFREWKEFLLFLKKMEPVSIENTVAIRSAKENHFLFIEKMAQILEKIRNQGTLIVQDDDVDVIYKLNALNFIEGQGERLRLSRDAVEWLGLGVEEKALYCYSHPKNTLRSMPQVSHELIRQAEKALLPILDKGWVFFDDFMQGVIVPLGEYPSVVLRKEGRVWRYTTPYYSTEEKKLFYYIVHEWLLEIGAVVTGTCDDRECFMVTEFGRKLLKGS